MDLLVVSHERGDSAQQEVLPAKLVLGIDDPLELEGSSDGGEWERLLPFMQTLGDGLDETAVGRFLGEPDLQSSSGLLPGRDGGWGLTLEDMGGGLVGLVTSGAIVMGLVLPAFEVAAHDTLSAAVLADPAVFAKGFSVHGPAKGLPVNP